MIKRIIALSLLLIANIVLLAVAVVPHHHHGAMICLMEAHCHHGHEDTDASESRRNTPDRPYGHEHSGDAHCCKMGDWLLPNIEYEHRHQPHSLCLTCHHGNDLFVATLPDFSLSEIQPVNLPFRQAPIDIIILPTFVSRIHGLRAPPFC